MSIAKRVQFKVPLGNIVITPGALAKIGPDQYLTGLARHATGDWGDVPPEDAELNNLALKDGSRILSAYGDEPMRFWIITEADRSATTILMPDEY